jgi:hypothetical protein
MSSTLNDSNIADTPLICFRESAIHGIGGFARVDISAGTLVAEYTGERITKDESLRRCEAGNEFIFALDDEWDLDGSVIWNQARYLNHSCKPNCVAERVDGRVWIVARRNIRAGEELTFNYGYGLEDYREHECRCGAAGCVGYMVSPEFYEHVKWQNELADEFTQDTSGSS